jgi:16S rRNA (adenine1518-N6/adenine1519-N6)-dimethyltransferase
MKGGTQALGTFKAGMKRHGLRLKKGLGQHILKNRGVIHEIIARAGFGASDHVIEVGPGLGALTLPLAQSVRHIDAVEKDPRLAEMLAQNLAREGILNVSLVIQDILEVDFSDFLPPSGGKVGVIGNLPYHISSPFLEKLIENRRQVSRAVLMFQREVARRLTASPRNKEYGALSVLIQYHARLSSLLEVSRDAFYPIPKVDSMVVEIDFERPHPGKTLDEEHFRRIVRNAFSHRRKTLVNSLRASPCPWSVDDVLLALRECRIDPRARAEALSIDDFLCLSHSLSPNPPSILCSPSEISGFGGIPDHQQASDARLPKSRGARRDKGSRFRVHGSRFVP